jgi:hypothetical protein
VTTPTVAVTINTEQAAGVAIANGIVRFTPTKVDVSGAGSAGAIVVEQPFDVALDANGLAVPGIVPNVNNQYQVEFFGSDRNRIGKPVLATIPNQACYLHDHLTTGPAVLSDAQRALNGAQAAQAAAQAVLVDPGFVAVKNDLPQLESLYGALAALNALASDLTNLNALAAALTALDALAADLTALNALAADQVNLDAVAGALAAVNACANNLQAILNAPTYAAQAQAAQAGAAASDADATQQAANANSFALSAAAQAASAYAYSLSAASAQQQDLSLVSKQMHFSPNATLGTLFYDTGKDSNPAWVDQVQNASYMFETLNGTWLVPNFGGAGFNGELSARYVIPNAAEGINFSVIGAPTIVPGASGYIQNDGTTGRYISVPHSALNAPSGVIDVALAAKANLASWTAPAVQTCFGSTGFGSNGGLALVLATSGKPQMTWGNGTTTVTATSTAALTAGANTDLWLAGRLQCNNGGVYTVTFWTSPDGIVWTQLGANVNGAAATTVAAASNNLFVGSATAGTAPINGKLYAYQMLLNGLPGVGTVVSKFDGSAITASATGSYFQSAADGKHYSLNAGSGVTQTTTGNSNKPPRVMAIVWENGYLCIYDPTKPGCPLWKSFLTTATTSAIGAIAFALIAANGVWAREGKLWIGTNQGGLMVDFANDKMLLIRASASAYILSDRRIAARNAQPSTALASAGVNGIDGWTVNSNSILSVSGCVLPDAPVDPNTGLMQPTVLLSTAAGGSVIKDDGSGTVGTAPGGMQFGAITPWYILLAGTASSQLLYALGSPRNLAANFTVTTLAANATQFNDVVTNGLIAANRSLVAKINSAAPCIDLMRFNASNPLASLFAKIGPAYNTGWMVGDVRGCWLADTGTGAVTTTITDYSKQVNPLTVTGSLVKSAAAAGAQMALWTGWSAANYAQQAYSANLDPGAGGVTASIWGTIPTNVAAAGTAVDRSAAAGAYYTFGHDATGKLTATVFDGTTTRTVTTAVSYATGNLFKARMILSPSGTLSISVNGAVVASTTGAPLLALDNAAAVLTVGNRRALDQPWAGGLSLSKVGVTAPTREQSSLCYEQEKLMFEPGAVCALADGTNLQAFDYDASQQKLKVVSSGFENSLIGLTFAAQAAVSQGSFTRCAHTGGMKMLARSTTNPGVDIMVPAYALREELANRDRAAAERARLTQPFDFSGGFTATETNGISGLTGVSGWTYPSQANQRGVGVTGTNIPANTVLTDYSATTATLSAAATGAGAQQISLKGFRLPPGIEALDVYAGPVGSMSPKMEGVSNDYTRSFDGFCETVLMTPGYNAQVRINGRRWQQ